MVVQVNDSLALNDHIIVVDNHKPIKVPISYPNIMRKYWHQELDKSYASIEIKDCDDENKSINIIDSNSIANTVIHFDNDNLNLIKMPLKQVEKLQSFYLSKLIDRKEESTGFVLDNSLELYNLREENRRLKEEIQRLKYLCGKKDNNV